jgi:predicted HicB family RNase H-like nuclease
MGDKFMAEKIKKVSMRIPADLHALYVEMADKNNRSLHAQIIEAMETYADANKMRIRLEQLRTITDA